MVDDKRENVILIVNVVVQSHCGKEDGKYHHFFETNHDIHSYQ